MVNSSGSPGIASSITAWSAPAITPQRSLDDRHERVTGDNVGIIYGFGLKASIVPDTIVAAEGLPSPAIALDASITQSRYNFNRAFPGGTPAEATSTSA